MAVNDLYIITITVLYDTCAQAIAWYLASDC